MAHSVLGFYSLPAVSSARSLNAWLTKPPPCPCPAIALRLRYWRRRCQATTRLSRRPPAGLASLPSPPACRPLPLPPRWCLRASTCAFTCRPAGSRRLPTTWPVATTRQAGRTSNCSASQDDDLHTAAPATTHSNPSKTQPTRRTPRHTG